MGVALDAIDRAVAGVADPNDAAQRHAALNSVSPDRINDVVFGSAVASTSDSVENGWAAVGIGASPGLGVGVVCGDLDAAFAAADAGHSPVLVVDETSPADEVAMRLSAAIVTRRGGVTGHAAIVARHLGIPAVCGIGPVPVADGELVSVDGSTGEVRRVETVHGLGRRTLETSLPPSVERLLSWADEVAAGHLSVVANADTAAEAAQARRFGAAGVGLARLERLLADHASTFAAAMTADAGPAGDITELVAAHVRGLSEAVGHGVLRIRLLDAPASAIAPSAQWSNETDPSLGLRGVRLGVVHESLTRAQLRGVLAGIETSKADGEVRVEIALPLVVDPVEVAVVRALLVDEAQRCDVAIGLGAMIETPRACLVAPGLAAQVDRFSFGTNDLTQLTYGLSRDIADSALGSAYRRLGVWDRNPFETLDTAAVARLIALAVQSGRSVNPSLGCTLCGEHAADPTSIAVGLRLGIDEVSVSPFRVAAVRLAVAHAVLGRDTVSEGR